MNYLVNNFKKKERLERLETDLRRLIAHDAPREKLLLAAGKIRDGRVRVLRLKLYLAERDAAHYPKVLAAIDAMQATSAEAILEEFLPE
jgi:hypothetical protein